MSLRRLNAALVDGNVKFVVVGMVAGNIHGSQYTTEELDVVYETSEGNRHARCSALAPFAHVLPRVATGGATDFSPAVLAAEQSVTLLTDEGEIDLLHGIDGIGSHQEVFATSTPLSVEQHSIRVITLDGLIETKPASGRPKDLLHLPDLELVKEMRDRLVH